MQFSVENRKSFSNNRECIFLFFMNGANIIMKCFPLMEDKSLMYGTIENEEAKYNLSFCSSLYTGYKCFP